MKIYDKISSNLTTLMDIPSPSGYTKDVVNTIEQAANSMDLNCTKNNKGALFVQMQQKPNRRNIMIATHLDTLGMMVRSIGSNGVLKISFIGSPVASSLNGEYVKVHTRSGKTYTGLCQINTPSKHVFANSSQEVTENNLEVKIDILVNSKDDVEKLGISVGDYISIDPKLNFSGDYIKSRFLDNKLCAAIVLTLMNEYHNNQDALKHNITFAFSTYEEVGHGMSNIPDGIDEVLALDMACVGDDLQGSEELLTICAKDSSGPYDFDLTTELINICNDKNIKHVVDIYPFYGSDASASLRAGNDIRAALIGPGVASSHALERSHKDGIMSTFDLVDNFIKI